MVDFYPCTGDCGEILHDGRGYERLSLTKQNGKTNGYYCEPCAEEVRNCNVPCLPESYDPFLILVKYETKVPTIHEMEEAIITITVPDLLQLIIDYYVSEFLFHAMHRVNLDTVLELRNALWRAKTAECVFIFNQHLSMDDWSPVWNFNYCGYPTFADPPPSIPALVQSGETLFDHILEKCKRIARNNPSKHSNWFEPPPYHMESKTKRVQDKIHLLEAQLEHKRQKLPKATKHDDENIDLKFMTWV